MSWFIVCVEEEAQCKRGETQKGSNSFSSSPDETSQLETLNCINLSSKQNCTQIPHLTLNLTQRENIVYNQEYHEDYPYTRRLKKYTKQCVIEDLHHEEDTRGLH